MAVTRSVKRLLVLTAGVVLLAIGAALLVLPGPGLLLVLAGLVVLAREFPAVERYVGPVRARAMRAAEESVSLRWRLVGSACVAAALVAAGVVWGLVPELPLAGWSTGSGLILSGFLLVALLVWSYRHHHPRRVP
ncbi:hypothetical protein LHJ74_04310 [Streptomyces sp. N2-109]|uniref:Transmembrane protein PGPGW n=1 Tax=Streptomyces gossypii TaxID=2883101 RepID=A0ABT2JN48_9ACTN|nr:PGPGW domain-containing protein [Streptomyces gossypii]MCT2589166.1 hypothetical protein [Streptomyces gossypii]